MRFKLLRRRLTISAPTMAIRSSLPWPIRWAMIAFVLGLCAVIGLWAFEFGKDIAGLDRSSKDELVKLRAEVAQLRTSSSEAQTVANASGSLLTLEKASQEKLIAQIKQLEADNKALRDDLGFFEKLIPASGNEDVAIRGLQFDPQASGSAKWQVLLIQPVKNAAEFKGRLELTLSGTQNGKPWTAVLPSGGVGFSFKQYKRLEGTLDLPAQVQVKNVVAKVWVGGSSRASQTLKL